jgi:hypothetical protein
MRLSLAVITRMEGEGDKDVKDEESRDIWCEAPESKTYSKCDIPEELWGNWPMKGETNIAFGCKERNFWNCSARVLGSVIDPMKLLMQYCGLVVYNPKMIYEH